MVIVNVCTLHLNVVLPLLPLGLGSSDHLAHRIGDRALARNGDDHRSVLREGLYVIRARAAHRLISPSFVEDGLESL